MAGIKINQEIEIKLRVNDPLDLGHLLKKLQAREILPRTYELNTLFDNPTQSLRRHGQLIRIRIEKADIDKGMVSRKGIESAILTYKGPADPARSSRISPRKQKHGSRFKMREEIEVVVSDVERTSAILNALGMLPTFRYEKFRTTFALPGIRNLKVELDETPVGVFLELEGSTASIDRGAKLLGYAKSDYMTESYGALYIADCRRRGKKPTHMLFPPQKGYRSKDLI